MPKGPTWFIYDRTALESSHFMTHHRILSQVFHQEFRSYRVKNCHKFMRESLSSELGTGILRCEFYEAHF